MYRREVGLHGLRLDAFSFQSFSGIIDCRLIGCNDKIEPVLRTLFGKLKTNTR
jgi:hypothetical protein